MIDANDYTFHPINNCWKYIAYTYIYTIHLTTSSPHTHTRREREGSIISSVVFTGFEINVNYHLIIFILYTVKGSYSTLTYIT